MDNQEASFITFLNLGFSVLPQSSRRGLLPCTGRAWSECVNDPSCPSPSSDSPSPCSPASSTGCVGGSADPSDALRGSLVLLKQFDSAHVPAHASNPYHHQFPDQMRLLNQRRADNVQAN